MSGPDLNEGQLEAVEYFGEIARALAQLATQRHLPFFAILFSMIAQEASANLQLHDLEPPAED